MRLGACVIGGELLGGAEGKTILVWRAMRGVAGFFVREDWKIWGEVGVAARSKRGEGKIARRCMDRGDLCTILARFAPK